MHVKSYHRFHLAMDGVLRWLEEHLQYLMPALSLNDDDDDANDCSWLHSSIHTQPYTCDEL